MAGEYPQDFECAVGRGFRSWDVVRGRWLWGFESKVVKAYTMPVGKTFVLTDLAVAKGSSKAGAEILERIDGGMASRWPLTLGPFSSALGIAFTAGSDVMLRLDDAATVCEPTPCNTNDVLMGNLIDS